jgi:3-hydroxyacyl-CoA dehydrogenase
VSEEGPGVAGLRVGVLGAGLMGGGIAGVFAAAGAEVAVHDPDPERVAVLQGVDGMRAVGSLSKLRRRPT